MKLSQSIAVGIIASVTLVACDKVSSGSEEINKMQLIVKGMLIDGESAQFSDLKYYKATKFGCGYVNAKNKLGGYVGKKKFVVSLEQNAADLEPERDTPEAPRAPSHVSAETTMNYALQSQEWRSEVESIRSRYQAFDALVAEKCTDSPKPKEDEAQVASNASAKSKVQFTPYEEKEGFIAQYSDQYPFYAVNISKSLSPELRSILRKKGATETTAEFNKRSNFLALEGKTIDLNAEYGLVLLDGFSSEDAMKGIGGEYNADKGILSVSSTFDFCTDPARISEIPAGKEYGLKCTFNRFTHIVFSSKQADMLRYFQRVGYSKEKLLISDSFKLSKEKLLELPTASYSKERFLVGVMLVGRINKKLSISNFQYHTGDYREDTTPGIPFTVTKLIYFNSKNGEILASRVFK